MAVTGVDYYGMIACEAHYGPKVEVAAHVYQPTTGAVGKGSAQVVNISGSSNATAVIAGVAALIWSRFPSLSRDEVRLRIHQGGLSYPTRGTSIGYGVINAHKSLGGLWYADVGCGNRGQCEFLYKLWNCQTKTFYISHKGGDGPFTYRWGTGDRGNQTSMTVCPTPGREERYSLSVNVTDQSDGTTIHRFLGITVISSNPDDACPNCPK